MLALFMYQWLIGVIHIVIWIWNIAHPLFTDFEGSTQESLTFFQPFPKLK